MKNFFKSLLAAFQFLTIIPLPIKTNEHHLKHSIYWYPLVGLFVGAVMGYSFQSLQAYFALNIAVILAIFIYLILTRGLHLDGLMDTVDGFFSGKEGTEIIKVMHDPRIGSFAAIAIGIWFLLLFATLSELKPADFIIIHTLSRTSILLLPLLFPYAGNQGTGNFFFAGAKEPWLILILLLPGVLIFLWNVNYIKLYVIALITVLLVGCWSKKKINGVNGDVLGFSIEVCHLLMILVLLFKG